MRTAGTKGFPKRVDEALFWTWTEMERVIPDVALKENERHFRIQTRISFREGARILYGPTMAVRYLLAGNVAVGTVRHAEDLLYIWEARETAGDEAKQGGEGGPAGRPERSGGRRWIGIYHPAKRRLYWGMSDGPDAPASPSPSDGYGDGTGRPNGEPHCNGEPHWSMYVGALLFAYDDAKNPDVAEIWPLLQEEWRERGRLGETDAAREALFVVNAFLWENRFFYVQDAAEVEPLPQALPRQIRDLSEELVGRSIPFSWLSASWRETGKAAGAEGAGDDKNGTGYGGAENGGGEDGGQSSPLFDGRYALAPDYPWPEETRALIPRFRPDEVRLPAFLLDLADMIRRTQHSRRPLRNLLFYGPPGSGKSTLAQLLAQLLHLPYYAVNLSLNVEEDVMLGKYVPGEEPGRFRFDEPPFVRAFRYGGLVELMELNFARPGVLGAAHSALETPFRLTLANGETVQRHPLCIVVATMNLAMVGTQRLNEALKSRFQRKIHVPPMPREELVEIVAAASGLEDRALIARMADVAEKMQRRVEQEGLPGQVGTRELIDWAQDVRFTGDPVASAWKTVLPAAALEQRDIQEELAQLLVENVFGFAGDGDG